MNVKSEQNGPSIPHIRVGRQVSYLSMCPGFRFFFFQKNQVARDLTALHPIPLTSATMPACSRCLHTLLRNLASPSGCGVARDIPSMRGVHQTTWQQTLSPTHKISRPAFFIATTNRNQRQRLPTAEGEGGRGRELSHCVLVHTNPDTYLSRQF